MPSSANGTGPAIVVRDGVDGLLVPADEADFAAALLRCEQASCTSSISTPWSSVTGHREPTMRISPR